jgi:hypothetical protein
MTPKQRKKAAASAQTAAGREAQAKLDPTDPRRYMNPRKFYKRSQGRNVDSPYAPEAVMRNTDQARQDLGYADTQDELTKHWKDQLEAGSPVDLKQDEQARQDWQPQISQLSEYAQSHLGQGLTPEETAAIRGRMQDTLASSGAQAQDQASSAMAASGIDPSSGVGQARALQLQRTQQQGGADIEREITLQDLARKGELEGLAQNVGGLNLGVGKLDESGREYDVTSEQNRQAQVEQGMSDITGLESGQFTDLRDYAESKQQAKAARAASRKAAREAQPGAMETTGMILGAVL